MPSVRRADLHLEKSEQLCAIYDSVSVLLQQDRDIYVDFIEQFTCSLVFRGSSQDQVFFSLFVVLHIELFCMTAVIKHVLEISQLSVQLILVILQMKKSSR